MLEFADMLIFARGKTTWGKSDDLLLNSLRVKENTEADGLDLWCYKVIEDATAIKLQSSYLLYDTVIHW